MDAMITTGMSIKVQITSKGLICFACDLVALSGHIVTKSSWGPNHTYLQQFCLVRNFLFKDKDFG